MIRTLNNCPAPAKLNLFLHVTGRRPDGYHLLQTAFQLLDFGDTLHFALRDDDRIERSSALPGVPQDADLTVRAARLLQAAGSKKLGKPLPGANIALEKRLPMGGGLGGGSSDAATTLMALNHLWSTGFNRVELMALGLQLGADVPFFLFGQNAFAEGVGEVLSPIETPACWYLVIEPGVSIPTAEIFNAKDLTRDTNLVKISNFSKAPNNFGRNDLQAVATRLFPEVFNAIEWLKKFGDARMTGSGSCVFCPVEQEQQASEVLKQVPPHWKAWKAKAIAQHPLTDLLAVQ
ncbi:4-(cytidine 5'-diphospho)-2-C-methyl-D-erythritol kinase [Herminiimonas sp. CN]|uniref:4-(cytidine 5'-diphospho)-2-C-methyl-D-erythritol kinase n=1 Tax=Herminiimonas sp. CN TaxID=1349818 RepID=UPI0004736243|nr:4-(cytidine 5'-diphospho)-2-C-methyl-D-erythritol kinase [Herminiimonas sp. CN]